MQKIKFHYFTIPYIRKVSEKFFKKIKAMFEDIGVKIRIACIGNISP